MYVHQSIIFTTRCCKIAYYISKQVNPIIWLLFRQKCSNQVDCSCFYQTLLNLILSTQSQSTRKEHTYGPGCFFSMKEFLLNNPQDVTCGPRWSSLSTEFCGFSTHQQTGDMNHLNHTEYASILRFKMKGMSSEMWCARQM